MSMTLKHWIITGLCGFCLLLTGCHGNFWVYRVNVQQGNVITDSDRNQLHLGMSRSEVEHIMGTPVLVDTFNNNRYNYVYEVRPSKGKMCHRRVTVLFSNGRVVRLIDGKYGK